MSKKCVTPELWSPSVEYFDRLIEEQDCFEISLRQERAKNQKLSEELSRAKRSFRNEILLKQKEIERLQRALTAQEEIIQNLKRENEDQRRELEKLKVKEISNEPTVLKPKIRHKVPDVAAQAERTFEKPEVSTPRIIQDEDNKEVSNSDEIKPILERSSSVANGKFKKAASLVAQLVQGFEAVAAASSQQKVSETVRRHRMVATYRPMLSLPGESAA